MQLIDIAIDREYGQKMITLPSIKFEESDIATIQNLFGCLIDGLRKNEICFETYTFHKSKKCVNCKQYGSEYPVLTTSIVTDIVDQILSGFPIAEMLDLLIATVKKQNNATIIIAFKN